jgi:hypothetical protein
MRIRMHGSSLDESMKTEEVIPPLIGAIAAYAGKHLGCEIAPSDVWVEPYYGRDSRTGWDETCIVMSCHWHKGMVAPLGFCDRLPHYDA